MNLALDFPGVSKQQYVTGRRDCGIKRDTYYILSKQHSSYNDKKGFPNYSHSRWTNIPAHLALEKKKQDVIEELSSDLTLLHPMRTEFEPKLRTFQSTVYAFLLYPLLCGLANTSHLTHWWNSICHLFSVLMLPGNLTPGAFTNYPTPVFTFRAIRCVPQTLCSW